MKFPDFLWLFTWIIPWFSLTEAHVVWHEAVPSISLRPAARRNLLRLLRILISRGSAGSSAARLDRRAHFGCHQPPSSMSFSTSTSFFTYKKIKTFIKYRWVKPASHLRWQETPGIKLTTSVNSCLWQPKIQTVFHQTVYFLLLALEKGN